MYRMLTVVGFLFAGLTSHAQEKEPARFEFKLKAVEINNTDAALEKLLKERYNSAIELATDQMLRIENGRGTITALGEAMDMLVGAGLELFNKPPDRLALLEESVRYTKNVAAIIVLQYEAGAVPKSEVSKASFIRATAEIRLLREKQIKKS